MLSKRLRAQQSIVAALNAIVIAIAPAALAAPVDAEFYGRAAHKYATFIIARRAGLSLDRSHRLSFFSQFPDDEYCLNAVTASNQTTRKRKTVHSLHGGGHTAIEKRQDDLASLVRRGVRSRELSDLQLGIAIHALSDSYTHTYRRHGELVAFGPLLGHSSQSILSSLSSTAIDPDLIADSPGKFRRYACDLYEAMASRGSHCGHRLGRLLALIDDLSPGTLEELPRMRALARRYGFSALRYKRISKNYGITSRNIGILSSRCTGNIPQSTMSSVMALMEREFEE